jgi:RNA polymerase sigma-70 factor (ECF subfamily)
LLSDTDIIIRVLRGETGYFDELITRYRSQVLAIVTGRVPAHEIELVAQDVFIKVYRSLPTFDLTRPFSRWLSRIAVTVCCDYWRRQPKREIPASSFGNDHGEWINDIIDTTSREAFEREASKKDAEELVDWVLSQLAPEDRMAVDLIYLQGWALKEVAHAMEWSLAKTKVRALRARRKMKKLLTELLENKDET